MAMAGNMESAGSKNDNHSHHTMKKLSVIKQKIESLDEPWCDLEAGTCHDIEDVEDFVKAQFKKAANDLEEKVELLRTSTEAALEKAEERATDALGVARADLEAADAQIQARVDAIEEATEDEVLGGLVEIPEGVAGTPVGYVMVKETMPASEWNHEEWGDEEWCLYGDLVAVPVGNIEIYWGDVFVGMGKKYDADGYEVDAEIRLVVDDWYGDDCLLRSAFCATEEELPVLPNIYAGMILKVYREEEEE